MPSFSTTRRVNHSVENMFALVADVDSYPQFVPLCQALTVERRREKEGKTILVARMRVGYMAIRETFTTQVVLAPDDLAIDVSYIDGPFDYLDNRWRFEPVSGSASDVHFAIDYAFKSRSLEMLMGSMFDRAFNRFTRAFEERADAVYSRDGGV